MTVAPHIAPAHSIVVQLRKGDAVLAPHLMPHDNPAHAVELVSVPLLFPVVGVASAVQQLEPRPGRHGHVESLGHDKALEVKEAMAVVTGANSNTRNVMRTETILCLLFFIGILSLQIFFWSVP